MREVLMAIASLSCCFRSAREPPCRGGRGPVLAAASRLLSSASELLADAPEGRFRLATELRSGC